MGTLALLLLSGMPVLLPQWHAAGIPFPAIHSVAPHPNDSAIVYSTAGDNASGQSGLFVSMDGGSSWELLAEPLAADTAGSVAPDPASPARLFATTFHGDFMPDPDALTRVYVSEDSGTTWRERAEIQGACGGSFAFGGASLDTVYLSLSCAPGLWASFDHGENWVARDIPTTDLLQLAAGPDGSLYAFSNEEIFRSRDGANTWELFAQAPADCPQINAFTPELDEDVLVVGTGIQGFAYLSCGGVYRSEDRGLTWSLVLEPRNMNGFVRDPETSSRIFASASRAAGVLGVPGDVFQSDDDGRSWRSLGLPVDGASQVALSADGRRLYASTFFNGIYVLPIRRPITVGPR